MSNPVAVKSPVEIREQSTSTMLRFYLSSELMFWKKKGEAMR